MSNLKGLWIPIEILTDKNLSDKEKHIYSLVIFLSQEKQYCFCTNKTIRELLNISVTQVSKLVNSLKDKGYINIEMVYKENSKEVDIRKLIPIEEKLNTLFNKSLSIKIYLLYFYGKTKNAVKLFLVFGGAGTPATLTLFSNSVKKRCSVLQYKVKMREVKAVAQTIVATIITPCILLVLTLTIAKLSPIIFA